MQKKKKIVNILKISLDGQDPVFLGNSSLGRLCMPFCFFIFYVILPTVQLIAFCSCCFQIDGFLMPCDGMLDGGLRVRAARRRGNAKESLIFLPPQWPPKRHETKA
jgi:hypothetical protein